jgi:hypothetical protein
MRVSLVAAFCTFSLCATALADAKLPVFSMFDLVNDPLVKQTVYDRYHMPGDVHDDGASALSADWMTGKRKDWAIEFQRGGANLIVAGVTRGDHQLVDIGLRIFEWGFNHQNPDTGAFDDSEDEFHSTSIFLTEVCRSLLVIEDRATEFQTEMPRVKAMIPHVRAAAHWFLKPQVLEPGKAKDQPFTHRKWLLAFCLGGAGKLSGDRDLTDAAVDFAREGIALQQPDGRNPERGGFDASYQMVDALAGSYYYTTLSPGDAPDLMRQVAHMIDITCQWETHRLLPDGTIDPKGSSRIGIEHQHNGVLKSVNYPEVIQAFSYAARICQKPEYEQIATKIAQGQGWLAASQGPGSGADRTSPYGP